MKLIFATNNKHKVEEIQSLCPDFITLISLSDLNFKEEIPETTPTIEGNAAQKADYVFNAFGQACFAEDTGLEVDALNGEPGVKSARYAGDNATFEDNINKLLNALGKTENRNARFVTVIHLIDESGKPYQFKGICEGKILTERKGIKGFGYDPVFQPTGSTKTFAEMTMEEKNIFSHRAKAFSKFVEFLNPNNN